MNTNLSPRMRGFIAGAILYFSFPAPGTAAPNGFKRLPDPEGGFPVSIAITRSKEVALMSRFYFVRPTGSTAWTKFADPNLNFPWLNFLVMGDTLVASNGYVTFVSSDGGKTSVQVDCPGNPLALLRGGFFCAGSDANPGLYRSTDLGQTWSKVQDQNAFASLADWKHGIVAVDSSGTVSQWDPAGGWKTTAGLANFPSNVFKLLNVGDSLFAWHTEGGELFRCQAGNDRWTPVWTRKSRVSGASPFGIALISGDSLYCSRNFGTTWKAYRAPADTTVQAIGVGENRLLAGTDPASSIDANGTAWTKDAAGMYSIEVNNILAVGSRLFCYSLDAVYQKSSLDAPWQVQDSISGILGTGNSLLAVSKAGTWQRYDADGNRTVLPDPGSISTCVESRGKMYAIIHGRPIPRTNQSTQDFLEVSDVEKPAWKLIYATDPAKPHYLSYVAADGDRVLLGAEKDLFSEDGGNTWQTSQIGTGSKMLFSGGAFLTGGVDGVYSSKDPRTPLTRNAWTGTSVVLLDSRGDTVAARESGHILLSFDAGHRWWRADPPFTTERIAGAALVGGSLCVIDSFSPDPSGTYCGSLSGLPLTDGIRNPERRRPPIPDLRLNWGRLEGAVPGNPTLRISAGVDGRIRSASLPGSSR